MSLRSSLKVILLTCLISILSVLVVYWQVVVHRSVNNGFIRKIEPVQLSLVQRTKLSTNNFNFAGRIGSSLFLHDVDQPFHLLEIRNGLLNDVHSLTNISRNIRHAQVLIDSPFFFIADLDRYKVYRGTTLGWRIDKEMQSPAFFSEYLPINDSSILYRAVRPTNKEYRLIIRQGKDTIDGTGLIQKQIDGMFCTDGMARFDKKTGTIFYTYFYRNQVIKANRTLKLIARFQTIDTNSVAKISVAHNTKQNYSTLAAPPTLVNLAAESYDNSILVHSNLKGDNEDRHLFNNSDVFDVYNSNTGLYQYSFYIPRFEGIKVTHFAISHDTLNVIRGSILESYTLRPL